LFFLFLSVGDVNAEEDGLFVGGSFGQSALDLPAIARLDLDSWENAWKLYVGYNFGAGPINFGVEGGYVDLGGPSVGDSEAMGLIESSGIIGFGVAGVEVGPIDLFAKVGAISWDVDARFSGSSITDAILVSGSRSGTDVAYGIGGILCFSNLGFRTEYERYEIDIPDSDSIDMWSIGIVYHF